MGGFITPSSGGGSSYFRRFWQKEGTVVQGTWAWVTDPAQTQWSTITNETEGFFRNNPPAINDEYKWSNVFLTPGSYSVKTTGVKLSAAGIIEVLFGNISGGTWDGYSAATVFNQSAVFAFTVTMPTTADIRIRSSTKNASSSNYYVYISKFTLEKTA